MMIDALKCFVTVVEFSSLSRAAVQLEMAVSSVSRKIDALEQELGARLLLRSSRHVMVTDAGERFLPRARNILAELADGKHAVQELDSEPRGLLTVRRPHSAACTWRRRRHVPAALSADRGGSACQRRRGGPVARRVDVAVRAGVLPASDLVATRLAGMNRVVSASPAIWNGMAGRRRRKTCSSTSA
jgi:DNA-binding transcriptional LysR family regulator